MTLREIVVGIDGSSESTAAVAWAAAEAVKRAARLRIVRAWQVETRGRFHFTATPIPDTATDPAKQAREQADHAAALARESSPELDVRVEARGGPAAWTLIENSKDALMLVIGATTRDGLDRAVFGSVTTHAVAHARCPVVIVRGTQDPSPLAATLRRSVVLGFDFSSDALVAAEFAFVFAELHGLNVVAVEVSPPIDAPVGSASDDIARAEARIDEALRPLAAAHPGVGLTPTIARGRPAHVLLEEGARAELLVVGSRGLGRFEGLLLGSVGAALAQHARRPLAIVRPPFQT